MTPRTKPSAEIELQEANRQLTLERKALQEANIALRTLLSRIEQEKQEIRNDIKMNLDNSLGPVLKALSDQLDATQKKYLELLEKSLDEITSPFVNHLSLSYKALTPTEIAICSMIQKGLHTKEIAALRQVAEATVNRHREKIRRKLKLTNKDVNLATYLQSNINSV